jgi:D-amino-acid dehydrogenase
MRIIVLGAGIVGVTTAYFLRERGHEVVVVERRAEVAAETSVGNAGHVCPSYATPWAAPGHAGQVAEVVGAELAGHRGGAAFHAAPGCAPVEVAAGFLAQCTPERYAINKARMGRLARYSHGQLKQIRERLDIRYEQTTGGNLQLFRTQEGLDNAGLSTQVLAEAGVPFELLDADGCVAFDPGLHAARHELKGAAVAPWTRPATARCLRAPWRPGCRHGVEFHLSTEVQAIEVAGGQVSGLRTRNGTLRADAYVVACASASVPMLKPLGLDLPIYPVKGYAITVPVADPASAPRSGVMDEYYKVAITRMGKPSARPARPRSAAGIRV